MKSLLDLGTAGNIASMVSLLLGSIGGAWWRRVRTLMIARDREATLGLLGLYEVYRHLQKAEAALGTALVERPGGRRTALAEMQQVRDGVLKSQQALNTFFGIFHEIKIGGSDPLVRAARFYRARGPLSNAVICYEQALALSDDGRTLAREDRRACVQGLQYCAVVLGEREEAARWAREATVREVEGCIAEDTVLKWFVVYRCLHVLRLVLPGCLAWRRSTQMSLGIRGRGV